MAKLSGRARSYVERVTQWPANVRQTGWGALHDRLWFPTDVLPTEKDDVKKMLTYDTLRCFDGRWYEIYMDRKMLWFGWGLRLHTFYQGDDDAAPHDHPWWFITFPFRGYTETVMSEDGRMNSRLVRGWRLHFRRATHRHFVHKPLRPFRTVVLTGSLKRNWGFWPDRDTFVPHRKWTNYNAGDRTMAPKEAA